MPVEMAGLTLSLPDGWRDVTEELPAGAPPTLAREAGVGALQFSVAWYEGGEHPAFDEAALKGLYRDFCRTHALAAEEPERLAARHCLCVGGVAAAPEGVVAIWYVSNGSDIALVTYTGLDPDDPDTRRELTEATRIVRSISFG